MSEPLVLVLLLAVLVLPAVLIARSGRRLGRGARRVERLELWARPRGWRVLGADPAVVGNWHSPPFTVPERYVADALVGSHRGREATSVRLEAAGEAFHVLTLELRAALPVVQMMSDGVPSPQIGPAGGDWLRRRAPKDMSLRVEQGVLVGWMPGEPLLTELDRFLDAMADIAEHLEALAD